MFSAIIGCHSAEVTTFGERRYPPTYNYDVKVYTDLTTIPGKYEEIGYVEAKGGITVSKQALLDDMIEQAKQHGAHALIKVEFYDRPEYSRQIGNFEKPAAKGVMIRYLSNVSNRSEPYSTSGPMTIRALGFSITEDGTIVDVETNSPAESAGIKKGDRILIVDKKPFPVGDKLMLFQLLDGYANTIVAFEIVRDMKSITVEVTRR